MEEALITAAKQVPSLVVLVGLVLVFMRYIGKRDEQLENMGENCHAVQTEASTCLRENTQMLGEVRGLLMKINGNR